MDIEHVLRLTEICVALAFIQQSAEHLTATYAYERQLYRLRLLLSALLLGGLFSPWLCLALLVLSLFTLHRFQGPYNGGSDRMSLLILFCLTAAHFMPSVALKEVALGYLALQLVLSYFIAGWVKIINPEWRNGRALQDVFRFSAYPVSETLRGWADKPKTLWAAGWAVIIFELIFPLTILTQPTLIIGLVLAACFHFSNAFFFGLNRFFLIWISAYPALIWFQDRIF